MTDSLITSTVTVLLAIVGVAMIAVLVSKNANTSGVVQSLGSAFSGGLSVAISPVAGNGGTFNMGGGAGYLPSFN